MIALPPNEPERWEPFPVAKLPENLRVFVVEQAEALGVDSAFVAVATLVSVAAAIGNARGLRLKSDWREPSILWAMTVAESGSMKGPSLRPSIAPLQAEERRLNDLFEVQLERFKAEKTRARLKKQGAIDELAVDPPACERRLVNDATVEALAPILRASPRGLLMFAEEGAAWFSSFGEYKRSGGGDGARWCALYDAVPQTIDRKGGEPKSIRIDRGAVSVLTGIQPGILAAHWSSEAVDSGLLARCSFVMPPVRPAIWNEAEVSTTTRERYGQLVTRLAQLPDDPFDLTMERTARVRFIAFVNSHAEAGQFLTGFDAARHSKVKGLAARLALVVALARDPGATHVLEIDVEAGIDLARWFERETGRVVETLAVSAEEREIRLLVDRIDSRGGSISVREFQKNGPSRVRRSTEAARAELDRLVRRGLASWRTNETGGRPSEVLELSPSPAATCDKSDRRSAESTAPAPGSGLLSLSSHVARNGITTGAAPVTVDSEELVDFEAPP